MNQREKKFVAVGLLLVFVLGLGVLLWFSSVGKELVGEEPVVGEASALVGLAGEAVFEPRGLQAYWNFDEEVDVSGSVGSYIRNFCYPDQTRTTTTLTHKAYGRGKTEELLAFKCNNAVLEDAGKYGKAFRFTGSGASNGICAGGCGDGGTPYYHLKTPSLFTRWTNDEAAVSRVDTGEQLTISVWINPADNTQREILFGEGSCRGWRIYQTSYASIKVTFEAGTGCGSGSTTNTVAESSANSVSPNQWNHVVYVIDRKASPNKLTLYVNGVQSGTSNFEMSDTNIINDGQTNAGIVFGTSWRGANGFNGLIDEVALFDKALTLEEVRWLYTNSVAEIAHFPSSPPEPLDFLSRWTFDEALTSATLDDDEELHDGVLVPSTGQSWKRFADARGEGNFLQFSGKEGEYGEVASEIEPVLVPNSFTEIALTLPSGFANGEYIVKNSNTGEREKVTISSFSGNLDASASTVKDFDGKMKVSGGNKLVVLYFPSTLQLQEFTISTWVKAEAPPDGKGRVVASTFDNNFHGWTLGDVYGSSDEFHFQVCDDDDDDTDSTKECLALIKQFFFAENINKWVHVAGTYKQNQFVRLYVDGVEVGSSSVVTGLNTIAYNPATPLRIGHRADNAFQGMWKGGLDDFRIYSYALTADQIKALYFNGEVLPKFNTYDPFLGDVKALPNVDADESLVLTARNTLKDVNGNNYIGSKALETTTVNIYNAHHPLFQATPPAINTKPHAEGETDTADLPANLFYFKFKKKSYQVQVTDAQQFPMSVNVQVKPALSLLEESSEAVDTFDLPLKDFRDATDLYFTPRQLDLQLEEGGDPEAYLQAYGYFDQERNLGMVAGVSPFMNFNQIPEWTVVLLNGKKQDFSLKGVDAGSDGDGKESVAVQTQGDKVLLSLGDGEYTLPVGTPQTHYFDDLQTIGLDFTVNRISEHFAVITFTRVPPSLAEGYEVEFTKETPAILEKKPLRICKTDPPLLAAVTVCQVNLENGDETELFDLLDGQPKFVDAFPDILFFYERGTDPKDKTVQAFHLFRFADDQATELSTFFAHNLGATTPATGRRLALELDGQQYLLQKGSTAESADLTQLELVRISNPLGTTSERRPKYLPSGESVDENNDFLVKFNLPLGRQINLKVIDETPLRHQITPLTRAVPSPINLVDRLFTSVSTYGSLTVLDKTGSTALGLVNVDPSDINTFKQFMKIATKKGSVELTLDVPKVIPDIQLNDGFQKGKVLALYHDFAQDEPTQEDEFKFVKKAKLFLLYDLSEGSKTHEFSDPHFALPLFDGGGDALGGLTFLIEGKYYLLHYGKGRDEARLTGFEEDSLELLPLVKDAVGITPSLSDDKKTLTFDLLEPSLGKSIQVVIDTTKNRVTFTLVSTEEGNNNVAREIDLLQQFQTLAEEEKDERLTTFHPVKLLNSDLKVVSIHKDDLRSFQKVMRVASGSKDKELGKGLPQPWGTISGGKYSPAKVLFLYDDLLLADTGYEKFAQLYLLYDLDEGEKTKAFTERDLIGPLLEGKKFAVKAFNKYYLLGHAETTKGFTYGKLQLEPLVTSESAKFPDTSLENSAVFAVEGGAAVFTFDPGDTKLTMSIRKEEKKVAGREEVKDTFNPQEEYQGQLKGFSLQPGVDNVLNIGSQKYYNCDSPTTTSFTDSVFLCISGREERLQKDVPVIENIEDGRLLAWYKGLETKPPEQGLKKVALHYVLGDAEDELEVEWRPLTDNLALGKYPALLLSGKPYLLTGTKSLDSFALQEIPSSQPPLKVTPTTTTEGEQEAQVSVHGQIVRFKQTLERQTITLTIDVLPYVFLSQEGVETSNAQFIPALGQPQYAVQAQAEGQFMQVILKDEEGEIFFVTRLPFGESREVLLPNLQAITIHASVDPSKGEGVTLRS